MLSLIIDVTNPRQNGLLNNFNSPGQGEEQDFIKGDKKLAVYHRPVVPSATNSRNWDDDWLDTDTFEIAIGNPDEPPTAGTFQIGVQRAATHTITSASIANPSIIHCVAHGMSTGDVAIWSGMTGMIPELNNRYFSVTVIDADNFSIPENVTAGGTGGTLTSFNTSGLSAIPFDVSAATLQGLLSTISTAEGHGSVTVTLFEPGNYQVGWNGFGAVPNIYSNGGALLPSASAFVSSVVVGSGNTRAIQVLELAQLPVALCEPATPLPAASIISAIAQAGDTGVNKIYSLTLTPGTYGGTFSITITTIAAQSTSFIADALISAQDLAVLLGGATGMTIADISVIRVGDGFTIQFQGTQKASNVPVIAVTNIDLLAPKGVTGAMDLNTVNLYLAFAQTTADSLPFTFAVRRTRATGEEAEYFQNTVNLKRNLINVATMIPLTLPEYYTKAQADARFARIDSNGNVLIGSEARLHPIDNGFTIQTSNDGGSTWNDGPSFTS